MDAARKSKRRYPAFTLADLKRFRDEGRAPDEMLEEIMLREAGISQPFVTPQIEGGKPNPKVGRM